MIGAGAAMSVGLNAIKSIYGFTQLMENERPERPTYKMPGEMAGVLDMAKRRVSSPMPGRDVIEGNIGAATATAFNESRRQGRFDVGSLFEKNLSAVRDLGVTEGQFKLSAEDNLSNALQLISGYRDKEFQYNKAGKYDDDLAEFHAKRQSGLENAFGGGQGMVDTAFDYSQFLQTEQILNSLYPK